MSDGSKSADARLASDVADKALQDPTATSNAAEAAREGTQAEEEDEEEEGEEEVDGGQAAQAGAEGSSAAAKKKKKPKKKKKKAATTEGSGEVTTEQQQQANPKASQVHDIQSLLQQLAMTNQQGAKKPESKKQEDYKFWNTQPVPKFKEPDLLQTTDDAEAEGPILPSKICRAAAKPQPEKLIDGFEWCLVDLDDDKELEELYDLLDNHYVEDTDGSFRFKYSKQFLSWALKPPGWRRDWHIGVRTQAKEEGKKGKLVAFIAGIPVTMKVGEKTFNATEINFLTIHRRLRGKRLAPVLIKEVTRQCYLNDIYQALYTAGTLLPTPVTTCRYYHRSLDWEHLYKTGFSHLPPGSSEIRQKYKYKLPTETSLPGLRPMKREDAPAVKDLLVRYLERFHLRQEWSLEEIEHWLCSPASEGVVWSFVVEQEGRITDFMSYYLLESTVLRAPNQTATIRAAYSYYYATESAFTNSPSPQNTTPSALAPRLQALQNALLTLAAKEKMHVFNAVTILDNPLFLKECKFEPGDGKLHYYLFNWKTKALGGGITRDGRDEVSKKEGDMGGVGVVML